MEPDRQARAEGKERLVKVATGGALLALISTLYGLIGLAVWAIWHARHLILGDERKAPPERG